MRLPVRTKKTYLSDAEILIFDFLFSYWVPQAFLTRDQYPIHMNCRYSPGLTDAELDDTLLRLQEQGLIKQDEDFWGLTSAGGHLWELERLPDWNTYLNNTSSESDDGMILKVDCLDLDVGRRFVETALVCGLYTFELEALREAPQEKDALIYWRAFSSAWSLSVPAKFGDEADWELYFKRQTWWRDVNELTRLQMK